jgi:hypothetical protein
MIKSYKEQNNDSEWKIIDSIMNSRVMGMLCNRPSLLHVHKKLGLGTCTSRSLGWRGSGIFLGVWGTGFFLRSLIMYPSGRMNTL